MHDAFLTAVLMLSPNASPQAGGRPLEQASRFVHAVCLNVLPIPRPSVSCYGTYTLDEEQQLINIDVEATSLNRLVMREVAKRRYEFEGDDRMRFEPADAPFLLNNAAVSLDWVRLPQESAG